MFFFVNGCPVIVATGACNMNKDCKVNHILINLRRIMDWAELGALAVFQKLLYHSSTSMYGWGIRVSTTIQFLVDELELQSN